jgi:hypothetical protein
MLDRLINKLGSDVLDGTMPRHATRKEQLRRGREARKAVMRSMGALALMIAVAGDVSPHAQALFDEHAAAQPLTGVGQVEDAGPSIGDMDGVVGKMSESGGAYEGRLKADASSLGPRGSGEPELPAAIDPTDPANTLPLHSPQE